jgi:hypothetical protein
VLDGELLVLILRLPRRSQVGDGWVWLFVGLIDCLLGWRVDNVRALGCLVAWLTRWLVGGWWNGRGDACLFCGRVANSLLLERGCALRVCCVFA